MVALLESFQDVARPLGHALLGAKLDNKAGDGNDQENCGKNALKACDIVTLLRLMSKCLDQPNAPCPLSQPKLRFQREEKAASQPCLRRLQIDVRPMTTMPFFGILIVIEPPPEFGLLLKLPTPSPPNSVPSLLKICVQVPVSPFVGTP